MLIDNRKVYDISFDNYSFNQDHLIYRELDYHLLNKYNKNYHRLFINHNEDLNFISNTSNYMNPTNNIIHLTRATDNNSWDTIESFFQKIAGHSEEL